MTRIFCIKPQRSTVLEPLFAAVSRVLLFFFVSREPVGSFVSALSLCFLPDKLRSSKPSPNVTFLVGSRAKTSQSLKERARNPSTATASNSRAALLNTPNPPSVTLPPLRFNKNALGLADVFVVGNKLFGPGGNALNQVGKCDQIAKAVARALDTACSKKAESKGEASIAAFEGRMTRSRARTIAKGVTKAAAKAAQAMKTKTKAPLRQSKRIMAKVRGGK